MTTITLDAITLSNDLVWVDQNAWTPVVQTSSFAVDGSLIIEVGQKLRGRKVTLVGGSDYGWSPRSVIEALYAKLTNPGLTMTLTYKGTALSVVFDHEKGAVDVEQALPYSSPLSTDWFKVNALNFMVV